MRYFIFAGFFLLHAQIAQAQRSTSVERWTLVPDVRIGSLDAPGYTLTEVNDLTVGKDGTIYVVQEMEGLVRVFEPNGKFLRQIGRQGNGPGEFQRPRRLGWSGDSLWVVDWAASRVSFFDNTGGYLDSFRFEGPLLDISSRPTRPSVLFGDGTVLGVPSTGSRPSVASIPIHRMDRSGETLGVLGTLDIGRRMGRIEPGGPLNINFNYPLPTNSLWDVAPDGSSIVIVHRDAPSSTSENVFKVEKIRSFTDTILTRSYRFPPKPIPTEAVDSLRARYSDFFVKARISRAEADRYARDSLQIPKYQIPITDLVIGTVGNIWLRREEFGADRTEWIVLDGASGNIIATFAAAKELEILYAQPSMVWGVVKDQYDVPYVVRFDIAR